MFAVIKWLVNVRCLFIYLKYLVLDIDYTHYFVLEKCENGMKKKLSDNFFYKCLVGPMSRRTYVLSDLCPFGPMSYRTNVLSDLCHSDLCPSDLYPSDLCLSDLCRCTLLLASQGASVYIRTGWEIRKGYGELRPAP